MKEGIGYVRVSTAEQGSGWGLPAQKDAIERWSAANGYVISRWYQEVHTGKGYDALERRPQLADALAHARRLKCPILVSKADRLARSVAFASTLMAKQEAEKRPYPAFIVTELGEKPQDVTLHMLFSVGEMERKLIVSRTKDALARVKASGKRLGNMTNLSEASIRGAAANARNAEAFAAQIMPLIEDLRKMGKTTLREYAEGLNKFGTKTLRGQDWHAQSVARIIRYATREPTVPRGNRVEITPPAFVRKKGTQVIEL